MYYKQYHNNNTIIQTYIITMDPYEISMKNTQRYKDAKRILKDKFGHTSFKPQQYKIIDNILDGKNVIGVMFTGFGKSMCFQMIPLLTNEVALVISPLIALMADQKSILDNLGITSCCYNSLLTPKKKKEVEDDLVDGKYQILYITPESLVNSRSLINNIYKNQGICMVAIDEAHTLSFYGQDWRPKYMEIVKIMELLSNVPLLCVTATATDKVIEDIKTIMNIEQCELIKTTFDRPNLTINVRLYSQNTNDQIIEIIKNSEGSCIIYCLTKADTETMAEKLKKEGISSKPYHAGLAKEERFKTQEDFMSGKYKCISATIAFGMGINKSNIRSIVHYGCPQNVESFYQEIGRGGRDGGECACYMFYKQKDFIIQQKFINDIKNPKYKVVRNVLLHKMSQFVSTSECRKKFILNYFGEETDMDNCGKCDNCNNYNTKKKIVNKQDEHRLFQILSTIGEICVIKKISFGMSTLTLILRGSNGQKIKPWMKKLTYYGAMKNVSEKIVNEFIHMALEFKYIKNVDCGDCRRVLKCTKYGITFGQKYEEKLNNIIADQIHAQDNNVAELILQ